MSRTPNHNVPDQEKPTDIQPAVHVFCELLDKTPRQQKASSRFDQTVDCEPHYYLQT